jgi:hypothetical protein
MVQGIILPRVKSVAILVEMVIIHAGNALLVGHNK